MTDQSFSFTTSIDLPDGRHIYVSIEVPRDVATGLQVPELAEHAEVAQMAAAQAMRNLSRTDPSGAEATKSVPF